MSFPLRTRLTFGVAFLIAAAAWLSFEFLLARYPAIEYGVGAVALITFAGWYLTVWRAARREQARREAAKHVPHIDAARTDGHVYDVRSPANGDPDRAV